MERPQFSEVLSERRRQLGFSTTQASRVLRLKEDVLIAFEEGDFDAMPKSGYAQGMLSSYARYLGLDAAQVVELYVEELEGWRRESRRSSGRRGAEGMRASGNAGQPYVAKRGLLPTSGGPAGDMGSFATTRVRARGGSYQDEDDVDYEDGYGSDRPVEYGYAQTHPYTNRAPARRTRRGTGQSRGDIETRGVANRDYEDDLRIGVGARSYAAASTSQGRRSRRTNSSTRPRVRRQQGRNRDGSRQRQRRRGGSSSLLQSQSQSLVALLVAVIVISVLLVVTISSCINQNFNASHSVPVTTATTESEDKSTATGGTTAKNGSQSSNSQGQSSGTGSKASDEATSASGTDGKSTTTGETTVSVSVADGAVTWLEIVCDGKSDVADTVTGPWQQTYTVEDSLSIQASETSAVTVTQNGRQVQFESSTGGIGTMRIQGTKKSDSSTKKTGSSSSSADKESSEESDSEETSSSRKSSSSSNSSDSSAAKMGNNAQDEEDESETSSTGSRSSRTSSAGDSYDDESGYDESDADV